MCVYSILSAQIFFHTSLVAYFLAETHVGMDSQSTNSSSTEINQQQTPIAISVTAVNDSEHPDEREELQFTEKEFNDFCEGTDDPLLQFIQNELNQQSTAATSSVRSSNAPQPLLRFKNTYRIEPTKKFFPDKASRIIESLFQSELEEAVYSPDFCSKMACELSEHIKDQVKTQMDIPRYKLVSFVTIGQRRDQGAIVGSRCAWNKKFDNFASSCFKNTSLFAVGVIFVAYTE